MTDTSFEIVGAHAVENQTVTVKNGFRENPWYPLFFWGWFF